MEKKEVQDISFACNPAFYVHRYLLGVYFKCPGYILSHVEDFAVWLLKKMDLWVRRPKSPTKDSLGVVNNEKTLSLKPVLAYASVINTGPYTSSQRRMEQRPFTKQFEVSLSDSLSNLNDMIKPEHKLKT